MKKILPVSILAVLALYMAPKSACQKILTTIPIGGNAGLLAVNPVTNMIYVPNTTLNTVTVIDGSSNRVVTNVPAGLGPVAVAVNTTTNLIYVSNDGGGQLQSPSIIVIDGATNTVVATVPVTAPGFIAVNSVTDMIYFGNGSGASISVLDGSTNEIIDTFATAKCCLIQGIAVNSSTNRIYVTENGFSEQLVVIDGSTNKFSAFPIQGFAIFGALRLIVRSIGSTSRTTYAVNYMS
jgi:YVTN family beta-propeller protein